ncbi:MAG: hypothetical protein B7Y42_13690 [Polaromonas sp. 28-63-22]|nr:MAG: hypothetical protein B7Y42_13690 [Polaromonas sp. 28-63-22]
MKVLNLQCAQQHSFEGWFASEDDFQSQLSRDLIACPMCESKRIEKMPSAPRLNLGALRPPADISAAAGASPAAVEAAGRLVEGSAPPAAQQVVEASSDDRVGRNLLANTEDVGRRFAAEARGMHYGDIETRSIRGQASAREAVELLEEGIEVMPLPLPAALKETLQ